MKRQNVFWGLLALILATVLCLVGIHSHVSSYVRIDGVSYVRDLTELDLAGQLPEKPAELGQLTQLKLLNLHGTELSCEDYETLRAALPECQILWDVPFQGGRVPDDVKEISVEELSDADIRQLSYLPALEHVDALDCRDYARILALKEAYPNLEVSYAVRINGRDWAMDTLEMTLTNADAMELTALLQYLPDVKHISLEGALPKAEDLQALTGAFPEIEFYWEIRVCGFNADTATTELDLSGIYMDGPQEVESVLGYLPSLERVIMCDCGISNEEMDALGKRNPDVRFVWSVRMGNRAWLRTDAISFISPKGNVVFDEDAYNLRYCVDMVVLDLGHQRITNCEFVQYMPKLKYLILADTRVSDLAPLSNHPSLIYLEIFLTLVRDYSPLLTCTQLEDLNICYTNGDPTPLEQMTWLKRLWWGPDNLTKRYIVDMLPDTEVVINCFSSTGNGWREGQHYYDHRDILGMPYLIG